MNAVSENVLVDSVERLATMTAAEVNDLPYGFLILDGEGIVRLYNRYESRMSRLSADRVVGRNWFREIAPCTRVEAFYGAFERLVQDPDAPPEHFSFRFHFLHGAQDVIVQMTRAPDVQGSVFMTVVRRNLTEGDGTRAPAVMLNETEGAVLGPVGVALPVPVAAFARMLDVVSPSDVRMLAAEVGVSVATLAQQLAKQAGEESLSASPALLRAGVLDASLARSGFGRLAINATRFETGGCIGLTVRPPTASVSAGLATFYEEVLASALEHSVGRRLLVRCLDGGDPTVLPWLFVAVPEENAAALEDVGRTPAPEIARRLGLFVESDETVDQGRAF